MCGGSIDVVNNESVAECEYCGTKQTLPTAQDENLQALFNRANQLRMKSEFDRAETLYEKIIQNKPDEPEAHWGLILCKFGIEYVEDPKTFKRIPTCHRTSFDSITADDDYKEALKYSDSIQRALYENEAKEIDRIQKEILVLSSKEELYDVFICYKETDENGQRTPDSAIANDIYHQLTNEGFKVFYAAISLEDKLGSAYEPCIFAALNSSKVMLAIGTKPEYFNAVWVKNEWSRFLKMMKNDKSKLLIPCYKGMDAYDLPDEFAHLQAQDMNKIGFINDIVRGIKKVVIKDKPKTENAKTVVVNTPVNANVHSLLRRVFIFLEDGDFKSADEYCEKVLDIEPENAQAYLGKLMSEYQVKQKEMLKDLPKPFDYSNNYQKIMKFDEKNIKSEVQSYIAHINERNYLDDCENKYQKALYIYNRNGSSTDSMIEAKKMFIQLGKYKNSNEFIAKCDEKIKEINYQYAVNIYQRNSAKDGIMQAKTLFINLGSYKDSSEWIAKCDEAIAELPLKDNYKHADELVSEAKALYDTSIKENIVKAVSALEQASSIFAKLDKYKNSPERVIKCQAQIQDYQNKVKELDIKAKRTKKIVICVSIIAVIEISIIILTPTVIIPTVKYNHAVSLLENGDYDNAIIVLSELGNYKDSVRKLTETKNIQKYNNANKLFEEKKYDEAATLFSELGDYKDSKEKYDNLIQHITTKASVVISAGCNHIVGLKKDGTVVATGSNNYGNDVYAKGVSGWKDIISISAGLDHTVGLKEDGITVATGSNDYGQCDVSDWKNIIAISAGWTYTIGLKTYGTVVATGSNDYGQCDVSGWKDIIDISAGSNHTVGLKKDKTVVATGSNDYGQCDVSNWKDIIAVSAGDGHTVGLKKDETVVATGSNDYGQCDVSDWKNIIAVSAGDGHTVGLKKDGTVVATGSNDYSKCDVSSWKDIIAVSAGSFHTVGLKTDGTVVAAGLNYYGRGDVSGWTLKTNWNSET